MPSLDQGLYTRIRDFLLRPELRLHDVGRRRNALDDAFRYWNPAVLTLVNFDGDLRSFATHMITVLTDYGCFEGIHCLEQFLDSLKVGEGVETIQLADDLIWDLKREMPCGASVVNRETLADLANKDEVQDRNDVVAGRYKLVSSEPRSTGSLRSNSAIVKAIDLQSPNYRAVAIKRLSEPVPTDLMPTLRERISSIASLEHPHLVPIYDWDQSALSYIVFRWVGGGSLADRMVKPMSRSAVADYISQIASALMYAHSAGVVHGNIKPSNVLLDDKVEFLYLTDFSLRARGGFDSPSRQTGPHTDEYTAPEILLGAEPTAESDQYSLGLIAYQLLTGERPFADETEILADDSGRKPLPRNPAFIPDPVYAVLERACSEKAADRLQSVIAFADAFHTAVEQNIVPTSDRDREQRYLSVLVKECSEAIRGYVSLRGIASTPTAHGELPTFSHSGQSRTGAGRAAIRQPMLYQLQSPSTTNADEPTEDVRDPMLKMEKVVLLGEPGSGKTTTLLQMALEIGLNAQTDARAAIPAVIPLNLFDGSEPFSDFVRQQIPEIGSHLEEYMGPPGRLLLMFDALNETRPDLRKEIVSYLEGLSRFVVSCRSKDYRQDLHHVQGMATITILDLDPPRIRRAMLHTLPELGPQLWEKLGGNEALLRFWQKLVQHHDEDLFWRRGQEPTYSTREEDDAWHGMHARAILPLCRNPLMLNMVCNLYEMQGEIPRNRGELFKRFVGVLIHSEIERIASVERWADTDRRRVQYEGITGDALIQVANFIQEHKLGAGIPRRDAETLLTERYGSESARLALGLAMDSNVLRLDGEQLIFSHQLIQEYFASEIMGRELDKTPATPASRFFASANWWEPQGWEETAIILAGARGESELDRIVRWIAKAQPEVAVRCITESGLPGVTLDTIDADLRLHLQTLWLEQLHKRDQPVQARAALGRALGMVGDPRPGTGVTRNGTRGVPDIEWRMLSIPIKRSRAGITAWMARTILNRTPTVSRRLMSRYPITVAQYEAFLDDHEGYDDARWWTDEAAAWKQDNADAIRLRGWIRNQPMTNVTWYQALAFCQWLSWRLGHYRHIGLTGPWP